ncbi:chemotaxis protein [Nitratidesulfovibrio vulgaris]|uniref:Chemotaxis protein CheV n=2 Tax=Nitratidesulfovibrio vulgaris TaxID=881 RepID=Q72EC6_NITV2|nr:chemotaxis protein [Nitratidesulfovibrio vulgaris]GEB79967.1 chemotaxis protein CheV [Desulfovibrio desulfuricans]HBW15342.1 chemotaxis protein CheV [Desulfovibrio sp.]AAS95133.1 chemotaxis protein CheV [Nitratidesulfovibrio vulgaris str. Hildenborough]ABM29324.1 putative CheW protein [Nitratidesulfovibrio vulgaris DP4]ADP85765.1 response regulator receiver modulated CheW protein [Nitratidesulfovibrio vulgaris RCH1]
MSQSKILLESGTNELEIVEFYIDEPGYRGHYGVNVAKVLEIIRKQTVTALPEMPHPAVLGAFAHRGGRIIPLVDLAAYLGKPLSDDAAQRKIIITEFNQVVTGFLVSGVTRIHRISWIDVEAPGRFLQGMSSSSITGVVRLEGRVVFLLDMESIVAEMHPDLSIRMGRTRATAQEAPMRRYTVLHADDSGSVRKLVRNLLEASGRFEVLQADDGQGAWEMLETLRAEAEGRGQRIADVVQAVISDIEMPRLDGLTLCRRIKEDVALRVLPVALFSSLVTDKLEHKGRSVGADAQFAKPDLQQLSERLLELLGETPA